MRNHSIKTLLQVSLFALLIPVCGSLMIAAEQSQNGQSAADRAATIAPFIDDQTLAMAHIDFTQIQVGPLLDKVAEFVPEVKQHLAAAKTAGGAMLAAVNLAGGRDIYYVVTIGGTLNGKDTLFAVVPLNEKSNIDTLSALLKQSNQDIFTTFEKMGNCLVAGSPSTVQRLKTLKPDRRPEIETAFRAARGNVVQLLILPPKHFRRVIEEMMPTLPDQIGGGSSKTLTDGLLWAAVSVDAPPRMALRCAFQSRDEESAQALLDKWKEIYPRLFDDEVKGTKGLLGKASRVKHHVDKLFELLTPKIDGNRLVLLLDEDNGGIDKLVDIAKPAIEDVRSFEEHAREMNKFKQLALAMHIHLEDKGAFPAVANYDADGRPLLSWRVHILPYMGQQTLYKQFHLDEPWDSAHNKKLIAKIPSLFSSGTKTDGAKGLTRYLVPVGENTVFDGKEGICLKDIKDTSGTIMIVKAAAEHAVPWTKPADLQYDPKDPLQGLGSAAADDFIAVLSDGSVLQISKKTEPEKLRKLFDRNRKYSVVE